MSVEERRLVSLAWQEAARTKPKEPNKRPAPFSLRLSEAERARLAVEAAGAPLGAYIKAKVLGDAPVKRLRRTGLSIQDREALARVLALLGNSEIPNQLAQLSFYAEIGSLPITPEIQSQLSAALSDVQEMRALLLRALGMQPESE